MDLLKTILDARGGDASRQLASQFGLGQAETENVMARVLPYLARGFKNKTSSGDGLQSLLGALADGHHSRYLDEPERLADRETEEDGNKILGHILGSKDVSRNVAARAAADTGVDADIVKKMLPLLAGAAMGALSKQTRGEPAAFGASAGAQGNPLTALLDADDDGNVVDDVLNLARKFF